MSRTRVPDPGVPDRTRVRDRIPVPDRTRVRPGSRTGPKTGFRSRVRSRVRARTRDPGPDPGPGTGPDRGQHSILETQYIRKPIYYWKPNVLVPGPVRSGPVPGLIIITIIIISISVITIAIIIIIRTIVIGIIIIIISSFGLLTRRDQQWRPPVFAGAVIRAHAMARGDSLALE